MTDLFISYSRKNRDFVVKLTDELKAAGHDVWVDLENIPRGVSFHDEIYAGIKNAHTFLFVTSAHALKSEFCNYELHYAFEQRKRIIPLILDPLTDAVQRRVIAGVYKTEWESITRDNLNALLDLNWLMFNESKKFKAQMHLLLDEVQIDLASARFHKDILVAAQDWDENQRNDSYLLSGRRLYQAEKWLDTAKNVTALQKQFITASRVKANEERKSEEFRTFREADRFRRLSQARFGLVLAIAMVLLMGLIFTRYQADTTSLPADLTRIAALETQVAVGQQNAILFPTVAPSNDVDTLQARWEQVVMEFCTRYTVAADVCGVLRELDIALVLGFADE